MPPLNEGALLFMPVLLPGASITQAKDVMAEARFDYEIDFQRFHLWWENWDEQQRQPILLQFGIFETIVNIIDPAEWPRRAVKHNSTEELVSDLVQRLTHDRLISEEHASHINADFLGDVVTATVKRFDTLATTYHNSYLSVDEREHLYRIWLLRILLEELPR